MALLTISWCAADSVERYFESLRTFFFVAKILPLSNGSAFFFGSGFFGSGFFGSGFLASGFFGSGCGWSGPDDGPAKTACLFATRVSGADTAPGDVGLCGTLCDCNSECQLTGDVCIDESTDPMTGEPAHLVKAFWGREGYCRPLASDETIANSIRTCPDGSTGEGGAGGQSNAGGQGGA